MKKLFLGLLLITNICFADTLTVYPDAGSGNTTVDGYTTRASQNQSFSSIRSGAGTGSGDTGVWETYVYLNSYLASGNNFRTLNRGGFTFDTSPLAEVISVDSAVFSLHGLASPPSIAYTYGDNTVDVVSFNPTNNNAIVDGDYAYTKYGTTVFSDKNFSTLSDSSYNNFSLNASGVSSIVTDGISKFGIRFGWDTDGSFGGSWAAGNVLKFAAYASDQTGTVKDPKLTIEFTGADSGGNALFFGPAF